MRYRTRARVAAEPAGVMARLRDERTLLSCVPGAHLQRREDIGTYEGELRVRVPGGAARLGGAALVSLVDPAWARIEATAAASGAAAGSAGSAAIDIRVAPLPGGGSEINVESDVQPGPLNAVSSRQLAAAVARLAEQFKDNLEAVLEPAVPVPAHDSLAPHLTVPAPPAGRAERAHVQGLQGRGRLLLALAAFVAAVVAAAVLAWRVRSSLRRHRATPGTPRGRGTSL